MLHGIHDPALALRDHALQVSPSLAQHHTDDLRIVVAGRPFLASNSDSAPAAPDAIAARYRADGIRFLDALHGTFALVLLDARRNEAVLATDRLGIETICFGVGGSRLHFGLDASEVAASLRGDRALDLAKPGGIDPQGVFDYLYFHCIPAPRTVYRGVTRLLAGHALRFGASGATLVPYWAPKYDEAHAKDVPALEAGFKSVVRASVARAIDGARAPGAFLSGGTDSSTLAGMLCDVTGAPAKTYSIGFDAEGFDEMEYARIAARHFKTEHHEYYITPADLVTSIPKIAAAYDQPFGNSSVLPTYYCGRMAEADGVDRMLGGDGGDELFGGNTRYAKQRVFDFFDRAPALVRGALRATLSPSAWESVPLVKKAQS